MSDEVKSFAHAIVTEQRRPIDDYGDVCGRGDYAVVYAVSGEQE